MLEVRRLRMILVLGFLLVVTLLSSTTFYSLSALQKTYEDIDRELKMNAHKTDVVTEAQVAAFRRVEAVHSLLIEKDPFELDEVFMQFLGAGYDVGLSRNALRELLSRPEEFEVMSRQDRIIEEAVGVHDAIADLARGDRHAEAVAIYQQRGVELHRNGNGSFQRLRELQQASSAALREQATQAYRQAWKRSLYLILASVLVSLLIGYWIYRFGGRMVLRVQDHVGDLHDIANRDNLTGLLNRNGLLLHLDQLAEQNPGRISMLYLDLDGFKGVNDRYGHEVGDGFLKMAAQRIRACVRQGDDVARIGGDEFVAVLIDPNGEVAERVASSLLRAFEPVFASESVTVNIGVSIGIAGATADDIDVRELLGRADRAMYRAKREGRGRYCVAEALAT